MIGADEAHGLMMARVKIQIVRLTDTPAALGCARTFSSADGLAAQGLEDELTPLPSNARIDRHERPN
jgi:hypothetical protein